LQGALLPQYIQWAIQITMDERCHKQLQSFAVTFAVPAIWTVMVLQQ
jgi:hypothetical protein